MFMCYIPYVHTYVCMYVCNVYVVFETSVAYKTHSLNYFTSSFSFQASKIVNIVVSAEDFKPAGYQIASSTVMQDRKFIYNITLSYKVNFTVNTVPIYERYGVHALMSR